eukprot:2319830-Pyramimonas_sp.AAC.2
MYLSIVELLQHIWGLPTSQLAIPIGGAIMLKILKLRFSQFALGLRFKGETTYICCILLEKTVYTPRTTSAFTHPPNNRVFFGLSYETNTESAIASTTRAGSGSANSRLLTVVGAILR